MNNLELKSSAELIDNMKLTVERSRLNKAECDMALEEEELCGEEISEQLQIESCLIEAASKRVEQYKKEGHFLFSASAVSERSSVRSTYFNEMSAPDSIDGVFMEVEDLKSLPVSNESSLKICQALSRRVGNTLAKLEQALKDNEEKQRSLAAKENAEIKMSKEKLKDSFDPRSRVMVRSSLFSVPYFKDRCGGTAPMNEETEKKIENGYLDLYTTKSRPWLTSEKEILQKAVLNDYKQKSVRSWLHRKKVAEKKLFDADDESDDEEKMHDEIDECNARLHFLNEVPIEKMEIPKDFDIDWSQIAAQVFDGYRTPEECQLLWINYLHTSINKEGWSESEDVSITKMVPKFKNGKPKWAEVAESLGTGRTPFQVMQRYVSFIKPALEPTRWTKADSEKLLNTINTLRVGNYIPWIQVSQHLLGYTVTQIQTRWRIMNPQQLKGTFTSEEDYILLKGLYMFGLNWNLIIHYLPGRQKFQAKNRFKKAILPGLTYNPWRAKEDKKILENCSPSSQHWRTMSSMLRKRDACEVRLRFYTLQFWQNMSGRTVMPPPLFPLSKTVQVSEINAMRKLLNCFNKRFTGVVDGSLIKGNCNKFLQNPVVINTEEQGSAEPTDLDPLAITPNVALKCTPKRRKLPISRVPSWPNRALVEFFLPSRTMEQKGAHNPVDHKSTEVCLFLAQMLRLNIKRHITAEETSELGSLKFTKQDISFVRRTAEEANESDLCGDSMCLVPPNSVTVGAFRSLLLHKEKLKEMSSKLFLFHRIPPSLFFKLGDKVKDLTTVLANKEIDSDCEGDKMVVVHKEEPKDGVNSRGRLKRAAAIKARGVNAGFFAHQPSLAEVVANQNLVKGSMPENLGRERCNDDLSEEEVRKKEDKLLFHRMLSMFFWPMQFTRATVPAPVKKVSQEKLRLLNYHCEHPKEVSDDEDVTIEQDQPKPKFSGKLGFLDIEEHEKLIKDMEARDRFERLTKKRLGGREDMNNFIVQSGSVPDDEILASKKEIISMKRSLVIKKLWDDRRKGLRPQRKRRSFNQQKRSLDGERKSERISKRAKHQ